MDSDKKILASYLETVKNISDKEYQLRVWIQGGGIEVDDFDETVCNFFQDGNGIIKNYREFEITDKQYHLLIKLRDEFKAFCHGPALRYYLPQEFINKPEWKKLMNLAKEVLKEFNT